ncbi:hypothetical protein NE865_06742 [Phthorimaea operculella]|nr:hypothetical protein NE865_06742 [Phthorimaea operculella]
MAASALSTPNNTISRENLPVLIRNNTCILNDSVEFVSDCDASMMETDSPIRKPLADLQPISKKLFHSPANSSPKQSEHCRSKIEHKRQARKRKQILIPDSDEKIKRAYINELERDGYSPDVHGGIRKKVLISLFHNREYSMDFS